MYRLFDTFNHYTISRHRTLKALAKAAKKHSAMIRRSSGPTSYIPTSYRNDDLTRISDEDAAEISRIESTH